MCFSVKLFFCLSIFLSTHFCVYPLFCLSIFLSIHFRSIFLYMSVYISVYLSVYQTIYLTQYQPYQYYGPYPYTYMLSINPSHQGGRVFPTKSMQCRLPSHLQVAVRNCLLGREAVGVQKTIFEGGPNGWGIPWLPWLKLY